MPADANNDGIVNTQDIAVITANWLQTSSDGLAHSSAVPEPTTVGLAMIGGLALLTCRRRRLLSFSFASQSDER